MTSPADSSSARYQKPKLSNLPPEIILSILEQFPDVTSLNNAIHAHPHIYHTFKGRPEPTTNKVFRNEFPEPLYTHAVVCHLVEQHRLKLPYLNRIPDDKLKAKVMELRKHQNMARTYKPSFKSALSISERHSKVEALADAFLRDCASAGGQVVPSLRDSLQRRSATETEKIRVQQAICLFQILSSFCRLAFFPKDGNRGTNVGCHGKVLLLQTLLVNNVLAPWEMHQVLAIQGFFRRVLHGTGRDELRSERVMPGLLTDGIDFLHHAICVISNAHSIGQYIKPREHKWFARPQHALGMILCRGDGDLWTRKSPQDLSQYRAFWHGDKKGVESWAKLENKQLTKYRNDPVWMDMFARDLQLLEGALDLWYAALWDAARWEDIEPSVSNPEADCWRGVEYPPDPTRLTFYIMGHPEELDLEDL